MRDKGCSPAAAEFFVSPDGDDNWSGRLPEPKRDCTDGPFATLEQAQKAVRRLKGRSRLKQPVRVVLRGGTFFLKSPLAFALRDSGHSETDDAPGPRLHAQDNSVTWAAYPGETAIISGGRRITGWKRERLNGKTVWVADLPEVKRGCWRFRQLFVNGNRRCRPRLPREGFHRIAGLLDVKPDAPYNKGQRRFAYREGDIRQWHNLHDVEVVVLQRWVESRMRIKSLHTKKRVVNLDRKSRFCLLDDHPDHRSEGTEYYVENVFEALERPGEWYLDRPAGRLYYRPMPGERTASAEVIAPRLPQLVLLQGDSEKDKFVERIHFEGITFAHTEYEYPKGVVSSNQAANQVPAAVSLCHARCCRFERCTFKNLGTYAIELLDGCREIEVQSNDITDLGAGGIKVWHGCRRNTIADNDIGPGGIVFHSAVGVLIGKSSGNRILHNHIHHFFYTGISVGWTWGYAESDAYGNIIEHNHVHDIGRGWLSDMGGIYTLGVSPGTRIRYNVFHDIACRGYGGWGIYTDEGSSDILIESNLVFRANSAGFHQHYGRDNRVINNIFALGKESQIMRSRVERHPSFVFRNNIVYFREGTLLDGIKDRWARPQAVFERNLYFDASGRPIDFAGRSLREWQKLGMDRGSLIADPRFVAPEKGNFRLRRNSPAGDIGFREFDLTAVGPRRRWRRRKTKSGSE